MCFIFSHTFYKTKLLGIESLYSFMVPKISKGVLYVNLELKTILYYFGV